MIVLSSDVVVKDLLDKKGGIYSDRPDMFIGQKIASGDLRLVVMVSSHGAVVFLQHLMELRAKHQAEIRRKLANDSSHGSQYLEYQGRDNVRPVSGPGKQDIPRQFVRHPKRPPIPSATVYVLPVDPNDIRVSLHRQQGPESPTTFRGT